MKKSKNNITKRILQICYILIKPFIPFIIMFLIIYFFIILIIDAIFVELSDENGEITVDEKEIEEYCESANEDNYDVYVDGEKTSEHIEISSIEKSKAISEEQIYSLMIFHNIADNQEITNEMAKNIADEFKSKYYYKTSKIITEQKIVDDEGNITWQIINEESIKLMTESYTISGHYQYNYTEEIKEERRYQNNKRSIEKHCFS